MTSKIDLRGVFADHFNTLKDESTGLISKWDVTVFYGLPVAIGIGCFYFRISIGLTGVGVIISALSILAGLLINVLVLLYTVKVVGPSESEAKDQRDLIKEVNANLIYSIVVSVIGICLLCILPRSSGIFQFFLTAIIVALLGNFILTLLMALKRLKVLMGLRFKDKAVGS